MKKRMNFEIKYLLEMYHRHNLDKVINVLLISS